MMCLIISKYNYCTKVREGEVDMEQSHRARIHRTWWEGTVNVGNGLDTSWLATLGKSFKTQCLSFLILITRQEWFDGYLQNECKNRRYTSFDVL